MKLSVKDFISNLLRDAGCKGIVDWGTSITCQCPFHHNRRNFKTFRVSTVETVNKKTGLPGYYFNCFSCGEGGTVASLVAHLLGCSRKRGLRLFQKQTDVSSITVDMLIREMAKFGEDEAETNLPEIKMPTMADDQGPMIKYLKKRNRRSHGFWDINGIIDRYELYFCDYGRMSGRIIMPIRDEDDNFVCYNDRTIMDDEERKSLHIKDFPYGRLLHGLYEAKGRPGVVLVEGSFDMFAVVSAIAGTKWEERVDVVNMMGTAFTEDRFNLLISKYDKLYLLMDHDKAGVHSAKEILEAHGADMDIKNCTEAYPRGKDPANCTAEEILRALGHKPKAKRGYLEYLTWKWKQNA